MPSADGRSLHPRHPVEPLCASDSESGERGAGLEAIEAPVLEPSGPVWVGRFPGSKLIVDLEAQFGDGVQRFVDALRAAGAEVRINATFRPPQRSYLMRHAWDIVQGNTAPADVPPMDGVDILWDHPEAVSAAQAMVAAYGLAFRPALRSRHNQGLAIDMRIGWTGVLDLVGADGVTRSVTDDEPAETNVALHEIGAGYGVRKLVSDPPHWSSDGR